MSWLELMLHSNIKAVTFDVFGTVVDWRNGVAREVNMVAPNADAFAFADAWRKRYGPAMEEVRSGRRPFVKLDVLHMENLDAILGEFDVTLSEADRKNLNFCWHRLDPWPDAVPGLIRLKTKYIIAPLSNGNVSLMVDMAKRAGLPWDVILGAEIARAYKPMPEAYLRAAEILDLRPNQLCLVAAHNSDLAAARACGLRTAFVGRPTEHGPGQTTDLAPEQDWDFIAADFASLAEMLGT